MRLCKSGKMMSNRSVLDSNTEDVILKRVDASNTEYLWPSMILIIILMMIIIILNVVVSHHACAHVYVCLQFLIRYVKELQRARGISTQHFFMQED